MVLIPAQTGDSAPAQKTELQIGGMRRQQAYAGNHGRLAKKSMAIA